MYEEGEGVIQPTEHEFVWEEGAESDEEAAEATAYVGDFDSRGQG